MSRSDDPRERVIRQATFYARAFGAAAILVTLAGSALVARFALGHMPFLRAWLLVIGTVGTGVLLIVLVRAWMERKRSGPGNRRDADERTNSPSER